MRTLRAEIVSLDEEHQEGVELLMSVNYPEEVPWIRLRKHL